MWGIQLGFSVLRYHRQYAICAYVQYVQYTHAFLCSSAPLARLVLPKLRAPGERLMDLQLNSQPH